MTTGQLVALALAILAFGAISRRVERSFLTPPMFFVAVGFLVGERGLGWVSRDLDAAIVHLLAELTLVLVLFTDASRIPLRRLLRDGELSVRLLLIGAPLTVLAGTVLGRVLFPELGWVSAALLAAILTPTDAALGQAVVCNRRVPLRVRQTLNVESGLNDGLALPTVLILASLCGAAGLAENDGWWSSTAQALVLGPLVGWCVGWGGGHGIQFTLTSGWMNAPFERLSALGLALLAFGGAELVGGNGFLAAFLAGVGLGFSTRDGPRVQDTLHEFGETEGQLFGLLVFGLFGAVLVPEALEYWDPRLIPYALLSLTAVRMVPVALCLLGAGFRPPTIAFFGWFGPRGLASILFVSLVVEEGPVEHHTLLFSVTVFTVLLSTFLHGATAYPLSLRYAQYADRHKPDAEHRPSHHFPVRVRHRSEDED